MVTGVLSARDYLEAHIEVIEAREPVVRAFAWFDADYARAQANALDALQASGSTVGSLHGLPIGIKDIIDTACIPTENGCPVDTGRVPEVDANLVTQLKNAGAIILGKTVTTELAFMHAGPTTNPHNAAHTPGGSSSGSAAAVAAGMAPLAIGTQTGGSVIRPAAYCGIVGFKPTREVISRKGVLNQSHSLDTVGVFARSSEDAALVAEPIFEGAFGAHTQSVRSTIAIVKPPQWDDLASHDTKAAFADLVEDLKEHAIEVALPDAILSAEAHRFTINMAEFSRNLAAYGSHMNKLGPETRDAIERGRTIAEDEYQMALKQRDPIYRSLAPIFESFDVILCPAATGTAPVGLGFTGNSIFNGLWTYLGVPAITLPLLSGTKGLPIGVQLVGPRGKDAVLVAAAGWLEHWAETRNDA